MRRVIWSVVLSGLPGLAMAQPGERYSGPDMMWGGWFHMFFGFLMMLLFLASWSDWWCWWCAGSPARSIRRSGMCPAPVRVALSTS
jgi:hypothetical protein